MILSPLQTAVCDFTERDTRSLLVRACAGSGKTKVIEELVKRIPRSKSVIALAFNKKIDVTLGERLPFYIQHATFNAHCYGELRRDLQSWPKVKGSKSFFTFQDMVDRRTFWQYQDYVVKLVGYAKSAGFGLPQPEFADVTLEDLANHHDLICDGSEAEANELALKVLQASCANLTIVDYDDQLYLPLLRRTQFNKYNYVIVDEAQDTNGIQRAILRQMLAPGTPCTNCTGGMVELQDDLGSAFVGCEVCGGTEWAERGRLIAVGDEAQSIYGFRGADANAMELLREEFNCEVLPLSVSYRCSRSVVEEARKFI